MEHCWIHGQQQEVSACAPETEAWVPHRNGIKWEGLTCTYQNQPLLLSGQSGSIQQPWTATLIIVCQTDIYVDCTQGSFCTTISIDEGSEWFSWIPTDRLIFVQILSLDVHCFLLKGLFQLAQNGIHTTLTVDGVDIHKFQFLLSFTTQGSEKSECSLSVSHIVLNLQLPNLDLSLILLISTNVRGRIAPCRRLRWCTSTKLHTTLRSHSTDPGITRGWTPVSLSTCQLLECCSQCLNRIIHTRLNCFCSMWSSPHTHWSSWCHINYWVIGGNFRLSSLFLSVANQIIRWIGRVSPTASRLSPSSLLWWWRLHRALRIMRHVDPCTMLCVVSCRSRGIIKLISMTFHACPVLGYHVPHKTTLPTFYAHPTSHARIVVVVNLKPISVTGVRVVNFTSWSTAVILKGQAIFTSSCILGS